MVLELNCRSQVIFYISIFFLHRWTKNPRSKLVLTITPLLTLRLRSRSHLQYVIKNFLADRLNCRRAIDNRATINIDIILLLIKQGRISRQLDARRGLTAKRRTPTGCEAGNISSASDMSRD